MKKVDVLREKLAKYEIEFEYLGERIVLFANSEKL